MCNRSCGEKHSESETVFELMSNYYLLKSAFTGIKVQNLRKYH